jgi:hemoglobin
MRPHLPLIAALALLAALPLPSRAADTRTLCARLGGPRKITQLVGSGVDNFLKDTRLAGNAQIASLRRTVNVTDLKRRLSDKLCELTGGPCFLSGPLLPQAPGKISLSPMEWFYAVQLVNRTLQDAGVSRRDQVELVALLLKHARQAR